MKNNRLWAIGATVLIVALLAGTWFIGVAPQLASATKSAFERVSVEAVNRGHEQTLAMLEEQFEDIESLRKDVEDLRKEVPTAAEQPALIDQIQALAAEHGVIVNNIGFAEPTPYVAGDSTDPEVSEAMGSLASSNFIVIPVTMSVKGPEASVKAFLKELQTGTRLFLVYEISLDGTDEDPATDEVLLTLSGQIFVLEGVAEVQAEGQPGATPTDGTIAQ
jgi:hypothetical protein